jgi:ribose transport system substrate-binding protein
VSDESTYDCFITSDNKAGGAAAADAMAQLMNKKGKALILGPRAGVYTNEMRNTGFADQMAKKYPGIKVLPVQYYNNDPSTAASIVNNTLLTNPDLGGVFGGNLYGAQGAANAVESSGAKLAVVCFDAGPAQIEALEAGSIQALVVQKPKLMGIRAAEMAQKILKGQKVEKNIFLAPIIAFKKDIAKKDVSQWFYGN